MHNKTVLITTLCMVLEGETSTTNYIDYTKRMVESYLKHTPYDILLVTNKPDEFKNYGKRLLIEYLPTEANFTNRFMYTLKLTAMEMGYERGYDVTYWVDADAYTEGWDDESFQKLIQEDVDLWHTYILNCEALHKKNCRAQHTIYRTKYPGNSKFVHSIREDRLIFPHRSSFKSMIDLWNNNVFWEDILGLGDKSIAIPGGGSYTHWREVLGVEGIMLGESAIMTKAKMATVSLDYRFAQYERQFHRDNAIVLDRWWTPMKKTESARKKRANRYCTHTETYAQALDRGYELKADGWRKREC